MRRFLFPLKRRSLAFKVVLLIPVVWLCSLIYLNLSDKSINSNQGTSSSAKLQQIQGFGPPIAMDAEADKEEQNNEVAENEGILPKPNKILFDPNLPIYKRGNPDQAGEAGKAVKIVKLSVTEKRIYNDGFQKNAFNQYASDMISIHRSLPLIADEECKVEQYAEDLPDTSVIICFHNEAWSVLLRTVHSVLERTPSKYLNEIILVDDFSDMEHTKKPLQDASFFINTVLAHISKTFRIYSLRPLGSLLKNLLD